MFNVNLALSFVLIVQLSWCVFVSVNIFLSCQGVSYVQYNMYAEDNLTSRSTSYGVYISQLIRFARASSYVTDLKNSQ